MRYMFDLQKLRYWLRYKCFILWLAKYFGNSLLLLSSIFVIQNSYWNDDLELNFIRFSVQYKKEHFTPNFLSGCSKLFKIVIWNRSFETYIECFNLFSFFNTYFKLDKKIYQKQNYFSFNLRYTIFKALTPMI